MSAVAVASAGRGSGRVFGHPRCVPMRVWGGHVCMHLPAGVCVCVCVRRGGRSCASRWRVMLGCVCGGGSCPPSCAGSSTSMMDVEHGPTHLSLLGRGHEGEGEAAGSRSCADIWCHATSYVGSWCFLCRLADCRWCHVAWPHAICHMPLAWGASCTAR